MSLHLPEKADDLAVPENADLSANADLGISDGAPAADGDAACTPMVTSCVGLCGPIFDPCLGRNVQCGACEDGGVCDLFTHTCGTPKTDCASLGAECGVVKNSCGTRLSCPDCAVGFECDTQTNKCVPFQAIQCSDFGYQCGSAWLGNGPPTNTVECGSCGSNQVCNPFYNVCDPQCTPGTATQLCADALANRGVECGYISDGCGGRVHCPATGPECPTGFGCAAQGEQNKCQPLEKPVECVTAGRNCGDLTSVCGGTVHCGDCTPPDVCNSNGVCGPPCTPKTCAELGNPQCGNVADGCGGMKKCNDCPDNTYVCLANNTCCKPKTPADFSGMCGTAIADTCGGTVNVPCPNGGVCSTSTPGMLGTCCNNTATCGNMCNTSVSDTCTGAPIACNCDAAHYCSSTTPGVAGTCIARKTCDDYTTRMSGQPCSNGNAFDDGSGTLITCPCIGNNAYCINGAAPQPGVVQGSQKGLCCADTAMCPSNMCPASVPNTCITDPAFAHNCRGNCTGGTVCDTSTNTCINCSSVTQASSGKTPDGMNLSPCSNGSAPWLDASSNTVNLTCKCGSGLVCVNGMTVVSGSTEGDCCQNTATCPSGSSTHCMVTGIPNNTCTGQPLKCGITCATGQHCSGPDGTCVSDNNCSNIGTVMSLPNPTQQRGGADGNPCNDTSDFYQKTGGGFFNCVCTQHTNSFCNNPGTTADEGTCACNKLSCSPNGSCRQNGQADGCGGTQSCPCPKMGDVCLSNGNCCSPQTQCNNPPSGVPAGSCNYGDGCGGSVGMQCCPTTNMTTGLPIDPSAQSCMAVAGANPPYGQCVCTPIHKCTDPGIHDGDNDGCGNALRCQN